MIVGWENMAREISDSGFMRASSRGERRISILTFLRSCARKGERGSISCDDDGISIKVDMFLFKSIRGWMHNKITRNTDRYRANIKYLGRLILRHHSSRDFLDHNLAALDRNCLMCRFKSQALLEVQIYILANLKNFILYLLYETILITR